MIFIDLDNFKLVNDNLGHLQGDKLLKETAEKLSNIFNANDIIARFGGDEFCIFSPNTSLIKDKVNKINSELKVLYSCNTNHIVVSASIGIAFYPNHGNNINLLLKKSDIALYNSKKNGKNQVTVYNDSLAE